jgi:hypothetical protein
MFKKFENLSTKNVAEQSMSSQTPLGLVMELVIVKNIEHFLDHRAVISEDVEPLFGKGLFSL